MLSRTILKILGGASAMMIAAVAAQGADYPSRPVTLIVPYGAGGGTDYTGRVVAELLKAELGQPVNVVNRTGAIGLVGHTAISEAKPDGYTIGVVTFEIGTYKWLGTSQITYEDFTPIALYNFDASGVNVPADSPFKSLKDAIEAFKSAPAGTYSIGAPPGGNSHAAIAGMLLAAGVDTTNINWVPVKGGADAMKELAANGLTMTATSLPESKPMRDAGKVRALAVLSDKRYDKFSDVPTAKEILGVNWTGGTWRGIAGPKGMPADVTARLVAAMDKVFHSAQFQDLMEKRGFNIEFCGGMAFGKWMADSHKATGETFAKIGLVKK